MAHTVAAYNAANELTRNYDAGLSPSFARQVSFSEAAPALALGVFDPTTVAAAGFGAGLASGQLKYGFSAKTSGPGLLRLRVTDSDGVSSATRSDLEPSMTLRSGRLQLQSASGFAGQALNLPLRLEHWNGSAWVLASDDSCTAPVLIAGTAAVAQSGRVDLKGVSTAAWSSPVQAISLSAGAGNLRLASTGAGAVDLALNLGATNADRACLPAPRPSSTGLNLPWLRSRFGSLHGCGTREDSDPSARASFGAAGVELQRRVHERQSRLKGFTVVELLAVLILVGVLAAVALPRLNLVDALRSDNWREQTVAGLRLAQATAVGHRRLVCASFSSSRLQLQIAAANPASTCDAPLRGPDGTTDFGSTQPTSGGVAVAPAGTIYFQPTGRATLDGAGSQVSGRSISAAGTTAITVHGESGHVE